MNSAPATPPPQYEKQDPQSIRHMFSRIASRYDVGNAVLSMSLFRQWNRSLVRNVILPQEPKSYLDLCCGTGDIALTYLKGLRKHPKLPVPQTVYMVDFCEEMLEIAKAKALRARLPKVDLEFITGDAMALPLDDNSVDCVSVAYGIRNVADPRRCFEEILRVLRPGGRIGILELTRPKNPFLRLGHNLYLRTFVPLLGRYVATDGEAYEYLQKSIRNFVAPELLSQMLQDLGFSDVRLRQLSGGIATLLSGHKA